MTRDGVSIFISGKLQGDNQLVTEDGFDLIMEDGDKIVVPSFAVDVVNQRIIFADAPNKGLVFIQLAL